MQVRSTLVRVELPRGAAAVPEAEARSVARARERDLNTPLMYAVTFVRNARGQVVLDRRRNTAELLAVYYPGVAARTLADMVAWDVEAPNDLRLALPRGGEVATRVTRRAAATPEPRRLETSEYVRQVRPCWLCGMLRKLPSVRVRAAGAACSLAACCGRFRQVRAACGALCMA